MLMTVVIQPDVFDQSHFATPGYRNNAEMLLRGLASNGLILTDPNCRLLRELTERVRALGLKEGQQIRIHLEEFQKKPRSRVVIAQRTRCFCPTSLSTLESCRTVHSCLGADTLLVDSTTAAELKASGVESSKLTVLGDYLGSDFERRRHQSLEEVPPIDQMDPGEFDQHVIRLVRFSKRLRFFDKQIGKGTVGGFRTGIGRILALWVRHAHFASTSLTAEIYTCVNKTHELTEVVHNRIRENLVQRLVDEIEIPVTLYFKVDDAAITHDRFLQTDFMPVSFSKGFDYAEEDGRLHRCEIAIRNKANAHLLEYRNLRDHLPPVTVTPP